MGCQKTIFSVKNDQRKSSDLKENSGKTLKKCRGLFYESCCSPMQMRVIEKCLFFMMNYPVGKIAKKQSVLFLVLY